jgi:probable addiction module antidote protein
MTKKEEKVKISRWHVWNYLNTEEEVIEYLKLALEDEDPNFLVKAIGDVVKSKGYTKIAKDMEAGRESLYKSFSGAARPRFETVNKTINSLGFKFSIVPIEGPKRIFA